MHIGETLDSRLRKLCGCSVTDLNAATLTPEVRANVAEIVRSSLAPLDDASIVARLTKLSAMTPPRDDRNEIAAIRFAAFTERLREFPADLVIDALEDWPSRSKWWPAWFELQEMLAPRLAGRRAALIALEHPALPAIDQRRAWIDEIAKTDPERADILRRAIERRAS